MDDEQLARDIADYTKNASKLENTRKNLVGKIENLMKDKIIPEMKPFLPKHYSICAEDSEIVCSCNSSVPVGFGLELRAYYNNKPIGHDGEDSDRVRNIRHDDFLCKKLNEIYKKYNFRFIMFFGEPAYIG